MASPTRTRLMEVEQVGPALIVRPSAEAAWQESLPESLMTEFDQHISSLGVGECRPFLLIDMGTVPLMRDFLVGRLLRWRRKTSTAGGRMALIGVSPETAEFFQITNLDKVFHLFASRGEAV